ncbi:MAG: hypothetical protein GY719_05080 [bacterium]|nr:hypothetical protein [bacterium]
MSGGEAGLPVHERFTIRERLGSGGMGVVYAAHGELVGGVAGATEVEAANAWMRQEQILRPGRMTAMLAPGFD